MQAGEHVGDDAVWARVLAAEKARQEAASGRQNGHESVKSGSVVYDGDPSRLFG
jgi:hypothetical protein